MRVRRVGSLVFGSEVRKWAQWPFFDLVTSDVLYSCWSLHVDLGWQPPPFFFFFFFFFFFSSLMLYQLVTMRDLAEPHNRRKEGGCEIRNPSSFFFFPLSLFSCNPFLLFEVERERGLSFLSIHPLRFLADRLLKRARDSYKHMWAKERVNKKKI